MSAESEMPVYSVVIPTMGRDSLRAVLDALEAGRGPDPAEVVVVDDRPVPEVPLRLPDSRLSTRLLHSFGRGPAGARNTGWRAVRTEWIVFLDDDVIPGSRWRAQLCRDLDVGRDVAACQGRIVVPVPGHRKPTDNERGTACLVEAWWITADMAYRRSSLMATGGFDEDFPRAFREDADLALRVQETGYRLVTGERITYHPVRAAGFLASVHAQRGNADNATMRRKHGRRWRWRTGEGAGRLVQHLLTTGAAGVALAIGGSSKPTLRRIGRAAGALWCALTAEFALRRIRQGPATPAELARMVVTSVLIPPAACLHRTRGEIRVRSSGRLPAAVLFDRDDTLIHDVPYNGDPDLVWPKDGMRAALDQLRSKSIPLGVVSNQSGVARGLVRRDEVAAVNAEVERQLGPFGTWQICVHDSVDLCGCRKPAPTLIERAASALGGEPSRCVVVGDTGADVAAARAAGARAILVPTERTLRTEIADARTGAEVVATVPEAVERILGGR
ncbi:HAD-IIIA family hydrolase [Parasphingorhabdus pacifica]